ncbi:MAG: ATP-binding protein [Verrucomicrobiales bacterium]|nr:ATP-binding protein [Verrucomicrobiales bacterium]
MAGQKTNKPHTLGRKLIITFSVFVLLSSLLLTAWMTARQQSRSLLELKKLSSTNASFIDQMRLPKSRELAKKLSSILDVGVGFYFKNESSANWPASLQEVIPQLAAQQQSTAVRAHGYAIAITPLADGSTSLILIRKTPTWFPYLFGEALIPAIVFALACALLAALIARDIVRPLTTLAERLPQLNREKSEPKATLPIIITQRRDEIGTLARTMQQNSQDLRREQLLRQQSERLATLGRIATSLAHEIKNPVAAIGLHADLLAQQANANDAESISLIREEVDRITDLVNQWLYVARSTPARKEAHDLCLLINNVARRLRPVLEHAHAKLIIDLPKLEPAPVQVDAPRIEQSLRNLLLNAAQAMPEGGEVLVQLSTAQGKAILTIEDQGTGFSEDALQHFGEAFFSEKEGGMGIGLTLACEVIQAHGGSLQAEKSKRDSHSGARITLTLPLDTSVTTKPK